MATEKKSAIEKKNSHLHHDDQHEVSVEQKLVALYTLQQIDSQIDKIRIIRGELPLEVQDLEDEVVGLETRIEKFENEAVEFNNSLNEKKSAIKDCKNLIAKYEEQHKNVRNNREYDSLSKEIEFQNLEIQLCEKRIREYTGSLEEVEAQIATSKARLTERSSDLDIKRAELQSIIEETEKDEQELMTKSKKSQEMIEDRLVLAYSRIRKNARNGLAVVQIERDACGGCFNKIPPQHQLDIRVHKKVIVCDYCGRILVDQEIAERYS